MPVDPRSIAKEFVVAHEQQVVAAGETVVKDLFTSHIEALVADVKHDEEALRAKLVSIGASVVTWIKSLDNKKAAVAAPAAPVTTAGGGEVVNTDQPVTPPAAE